MTKFIVTHETKITRTFQVDRPTRTAAKAAVECGPASRITDKEGVMQIKREEVVKITVNCSLVDLPDADVTTLLKAASIVPAKTSELRLQQLNKSLRTTRSNKA